MTSTQPTHPTNPTTSDLKDIQGAVIGFNKDTEEFHLITFTDTATAKAMVRELRPQLANGYQVKRFNDAFSDNRKNGGDAETLQATWANLWLSRDGLTMLGAASMETLPQEFQEGMAKRNQFLGDVNASDPSRWVAPYAGGVEPHAVLVLASDNTIDLDARRNRLLEIVTRNGGTVIKVELGQNRPGENHGREHFGFKDGVSQPAIGGFTSATRGGTIPPGEVFIGYPDAEGNISGQPTSAPQPPATGYDPAPVPPPAQPYPDWAHNGTFVVFRRLRQDVRAFHDAMASKAAEVGLTPDQLGAKAVGRWPSGAPMERVPGLPAHVNPSEVDPSIEHPQVLNDNKINNFDYSDDPEGLNVPRAAHIRKMNPRADQLAEGDTSARHRMVRRGITYGPEVQDGETPYGEVVPDNQDRGLLFVCFQSSIGRTFEFVQTRWANREDFQKPGDGKDPIISQDTPEGTFSIPPGRTVSFSRWVTTTGGAYFFAPSLSALEQLSQPS